MCLRISYRIALHLFVQAIACFCVATAATADDRAASVLHLTNGGHLPGELGTSDDPKLLRWRSPLFARPLEFPLGAINAVHYPAPAPRPKPQGEYCFELIGDDVLYGNLVGLTEDAVEVNAPGIGRLHLRREHVGRCYRWQGADAVYLGPNGLVGWKESGQWRDEGGQLSADQPGAALFGDLGIPEKAVIEIEISWKTKPNFVFAMGVDERGEAGQNAFHLEVWEDEIVAVGESPRDADVASVQKVGAGAGHVCIQAYLDQTAGRMVVLSRSGQSLATLNVNAKKAQVRSGVRLTNKKGDVRLERLRITRWNGLSPKAVQQDQARVHRTDGSIVYGQLASYDSDTKQFTVRDGTAETVLKQADVADLFLSPAQAGDKAANDAQAGAGDRMLRLVYRDGSRFSGTLTRIDDERLLLVCPAIVEPLRLPRAELRALIALGKGESPAPPAAGRAGRLELEGVSLRGRLVDGEPSPDASCLTWQPDLALNGSPLRHDVAGRIVYRELATLKPDVPTARNVPRPTGATPVNVATIARRSLHLRSGDMIPCEVTAINDKGVTFKSPLTDATFVPNEKVKSIELVWTGDGPKLKDPKRDRLLTLPRLQRELPPTHLICSKNGDFLRGRVLEMDGARLKIEVRLETREIPRDRIAQIIWLHPDELSDSQTVAPASDVRGANRVQILRADGNRLTFVAKQADAKTIAGVSDVLGECRAEIAEVDQLLFGSFIEQSAAKLQYGLWKLHHATEPKFSQADAEGATDGRLTGTDSPLVGKPAFPIKLDLLDGKRFQLADHKGKIVVVEFWATWCGPCLQTMPLVDAVVHEFADRNVKLVAINMEEPPDQIKMTLERHKLKMPVALDRDGVVAAKYAVTAIPQTVVIDGDGKIARLFVGGGKNTAESLRKALQEMTAEKPAPAASP